MIAGPTVSALAGERLDCESRRTHFFPVTTTPHGGFAGLEDPKVLPDWLQKRVKKIERALRLHIAKQAEWQKIRTDTLKHMRELMAPWKLTEAQMRKLGDNDAADDEEFSKELGADLCKMLKELAQKQIDDHSERDNEHTLSSQDNESGDEDSTSPGEHSRFLPNAQPTTFRFTLVLQSVL